MFTWNVSLSAKQVLMLMAFNATEPDEHGSQFSAVQDLITDAWSIRGARGLCEEGFILAVHDGVRSKWTITEKGRLIANAILLDAKSLSGIEERLGRSLRKAVNAASTR